MSKAPIWQRLLTLISLVASGFTALCCLGISAAVSLATAVGATFMTSDSTLRPLLIVFLAITVLGSAVSFGRHRVPWPLVITVLAAAGVYVSIFNPFGGHGGEASTGDHMDDHMSDHMAAGHGGHHAAFSAPHMLLVALIFAVLIAAQLWDVLQVRRTSRPQLPTG